MAIPTEPVGSIPRPPRLIDTIKAFQAGAEGQGVLDALYAEALRDTVQRFEATGSLVIPSGIVPNVARR